MTKLDRLLFLILWLLILVCPFPYASNTPFMWSLLGLVSASLLTLWGIQAALRPDSINVSFKRTAFIVLPFLLTIVWVAIQAFVPASMLGLPAHPYWAQMNQLTGQDSTPVISINPLKSLEGIMRLITYAAVFWLSMQYTRYNKNGRYLLQAVVLAGIMTTLYGLLMHFSGTEKVLMKDKEYAIGSVTATFINRNSYATYVGLCLLTSVALMARGFFRESSSRKSFFLKFMLFTTTKGLIYLQCIVALILALVLTNSRAGIVSSLIGLLTFFLVLPFASSMRRFRKFAVVLLVLLVCGLSYTLNHFMNDETLYRFSRTETDFGFRMQIYQETLDLIKKHPLTGVGLGGYEAGFAAHQNSHMKGDIWLPSRVAKAHNTYLDNAAELGLPAYGLLLLSLFSMLLICTKGLFTRRQNFVFPAAGIAVTMLVAAHALFDFSMQIPAVAITYCAIMGVCVSESWSSKEEMYEPA